MNQDNYYIPMTDVAFDEIKREAIKIWNEYDDTHGYRTKKIDQIKHLENSGDNAMYIIAMFDPMNTRKLLKRLSKKTKSELGDNRMNLTQYIVDDIIYPN